MAKLSKERLIGALEIAGANNDQAAFLRLYSENRISFAVAREAFAKGLRIAARWEARS